MITYFFIAPYSRLNKINSPQTTMRKLMALFSGSPFSLAVDKAVPPPCLQIVLFFGKTKLSKIKMLLFLSMVFSPLICAMNLYCYLRYFISTSMLNHSILRTTMLKTD